MYTCTDGMEDTQYSYKTKYIYQHIHYFCLCCRTEVRKYDCIWHIDEMFELHSVRQLYENRFSYHPKQLCLCNYTKHLRPSCNHPMQCDNVILLALHNNITSINCNINKCNNLWFSSRDWEIEAKYLNYYRSFED